MPGTPLLKVHESLGARFTDFRGWVMPVQYEGVLSEHMTVREAVGVFDITHLGRFAVSGPGTTELLRGHLCNDVAKIGPGRIQYTMALNDRGGVVDDLLAWQIDEEHFWVLPNGINFDDVMRPFVSIAPDHVTLAGVRHDTVLLAVQGPKSAGAIENVLGVVPGRFRVVTGEYSGGPFWAAGSGYTGESGAEIAVPGPVGEQLFRDLIDAGAVPCGLGARDTLRLEMGYLLWGQDLDEATTPLEAGLGWVIAWDHEFIGREALLAQKEKGIGRTLISFQTEGRIIPREGHALRAGQSVGTVTSGNFSPVLSRGIGMGYLSPPPEEDGSMEVKIRGKWHPVEQVKRPFIDR